MLTSKRIVWGTVATILLYLGVVVVNGPRTQPEVLPFFGWELFSRVPPAERITYSVRLVEVNGQAVDPPVYFDDAREHISTYAAPEAYQLLQDFGRSVEAGEVLRIEANRSTLETRFLNELESARYEVVRRRHDVLDHVTCDCFLEETTLAEFEFG